MLGEKPTSLPMNACLHIHDDQLELLNTCAYISLIGKLLYITVTHPGISFT